MDPHVGLKGFVPVDARSRKVAEELAWAGAVVAVGGAGDNTLVPMGDWPVIANTGSCSNYVGQGRLSDGVVDAEASEIRCLALPGGARLIIPASSGAKEGAGPHIRGIIEAAIRLGSDLCAGSEAVTLSGGRVLQGASAELASTALQIDRDLQGWASLTERDFANSGYYMGAKRSLIPLLMEPIDRWVPSDAVFVDLMCGSGAVTGAAARRWETIASDAQDFCLALAGVQSGGFSTLRAAAVVEAVREGRLANEEWLEERVGDLLEEEDSLLFSALPPEEAAANYSRFVSGLPSYPEGGRSGMWSPVEEVQRRRLREAFTLPSCLFTAYFADTYFGLRQSVEIDSIRHAIASLSDPLDRRWALGALVAAVSHVATGYGGHFAQPLYTPERLLERRRFVVAASKRSLSVFREFEVRLYALAQESEETSHNVQLVPGGWERALERISEDVGDREVVVYLDPPYKRQEYSRYYHVLETLVRYNYPSAAERTKVPDKHVGDRFKSEFFTRNKTSMARSLGRVIESVLGRGWRCAWSYGSTADASVVEVLSSLEAPPRRISGVSAPHEHRLQGRHVRTEGKDNGIREQLVMLDP